MKFKPNTEGKGICNGCDKLTKLSNKFPASIANPMRCKIFGNLFILVEENEPIKVLKHNDCMDTFGR